MKAKQEHPLRVPSFLRRERSINLFEILKQTRSICSMCGETVPATYEVRDNEQVFFSRTCPSHGVADTARGTGAREKDLLVVTNFICCGYSLSAHRTNTARLLEDFEQVDTPFPS